jgi:hypothetical protein
LDVARKVRLPTINVKDAIGSRNRLSYPSGQVKAIARTHSRVKSSTLFTRLTEILDSNQPVNGPTIKPILFDQAIYLPKVKQEDLTVS